MRLENLLNQIFGDELDRALAAPSNIVEFPLAQELASYHEEVVIKSETLDFSPEAFDLHDPVLETDLTRFTPSIIGNDDFDGSHLQLVIDAQQGQLVELREQVKQRDFLIRCHTVDLAAKDDQLKYMPELLDKALQMATVDAANQILTTDLTVEKMVNEELNQELNAAKAELASLNNHLLVKFGRIIGLISQ
ncbi:MAG: hypothetical protein KGS72_17460, partial [Cyanobacteria bacterium REEB67]|nr:hypothetical protein [Cyanobacteria bacterium REEB67]